MNWAKIRAWILAVCIVFCYALNSQNFKHVLQPHVHSFVLCVADHSTKLPLGNYSFSVTPEQMAFMSSDLVGVKIDFLDGEWRVKENETVIDTAVGSCDQPWDAKWNSVSLTTKSSRAVSELLLLFVCHVGGLLYVWVWFSFRWGRNVVRQCIDTYGKRDIFLAGSIVTAFQMLINYFWSLASTRIPIQTLSSIFQSAVFLIYVLSILLLGEKFTWIKSSAVVVAVVGVCVASFYAPHSKGTALTHTSAGIIVAVFAEVLKSCYQVWWKYKYHEPTMAYTFLITSLVAILHLVYVPPFLALAHYTGWEPLEWNVHGASILHLVFAAVCSSAVNVGALVVISLATPTLWSFCQTLIIPFSVALDFAFYGTVPSWQSTLGLITIFAALFLFHQGDSKEKEESLEDKSVQKETTPTNSDKSPEASFDSPLKDDAVGDDAVEELC